MARYGPSNRSEGSPNNRPKKAAMNPAAGRATMNGMPAFAMSKTHEYAPMAKKPCVAKRYLTSVPHKDIQPNGHDRVDSHEVYEVKSVVAHEKRCSRDAKQQKKGSHEDGGGLTELYVLVVISFHVHGTIP